MSFIIGISKPKYFYHFSKPTLTHSKRLPLIHSDTIQKSNSLALTIQEALKLQQIHFCSRNLPSGECLITTEQFELGRRVSGLLRFKVSAVEGQINIKIDILSDRHQYYRIQSLDHRIFINRALSSTKNTPNNQFFKLAICMTKGIIKLSLPLHYLLQLLSMQNSSALKKTAILRKLIDVILFEAKSLVELLVKKDEGSIINKGNGELFRLREMMNLFKRGCQGNEVMSQKSIRQYKSKQIKSVKDLIHNKISNKHILNSLKSYLTLPQPEQIKNEEQCALNTYQMDLLKKLCIPSRKVNKYQSSFTYTMANILIHKPEQIKFTPLSSGGFSSILLAELQYSFADTSKPKQPLKDRRWQKSMIVIKKQTGGSKKMSRNERERRIIQKMKNSTSFMLNRYYVPCNIPQAFKNDIFMDYIPYPTLKDFMQMSRQHISLHSKLIIMLSIVQGVRSVNQFDIVHLDLKPNNIMMNPQLQIKLLDFGESYHAQVQKCKPGFTMPYGCPQIHSAATQFNVKSDVYSLGVIIFEMLYKCYPFYFHNDANINKYRSESYLNHWLWCPQDTSKLGQKNVYHTLNLMISRCLQKDVSKRPELLNIGLILQECINMLQ